MRARKTKTEVRQEQIAQAALGVVERHGLRGLNVARVAKAVGVVPSCLYRHYPGKDGVLDTVLAGGREHLGGEYSIADIMTYPWIKAAYDAQAALVTPFKSLTAWLERVGARPAVKRGMAVPS